jgi:hypothetical protein
MQPLRRLCNWVKRSLPSDYRHWFVGRRCGEQEIALEQWPWITQIRAVADGKGRLIAILQTAAKHAIARCRRSDPQSKAVERAIRPQGPKNDEAVEVSDAQRRSS